MNITVIVIEWERINFDEKEIAKHCRECDYGIYQIYGYHPSYGDDSLLYIGRSVDQFFSSRLKRRFGFIESAVRPIYVLLGRIVRSSAKEINHDWNLERWDEMLCHAEKILIKAHPPALNQKDNTGLLGGVYDNEPLLLLHWGDFGKISPETSTLRLSYKYWNYETPISKSDLKPSVPNYI